MGPFWSCLELAWGQVQASPHSDHPHRSLAANIFPHKPITVGLRHFEGPLWQYSVQQNSKTDTLVKLRTGCKKGCNLFSMLEHLSFCQWVSQVFAGSRDILKFTLWWASCSKMPHTGCQMLVSSSPCFSSLLMAPVLSVCLRPTLSIPSSEVKHSLKVVSLIDGFSFKTSQVTPSWLPEHIRVSRRA